jgi:hypothetical protein
VVVSVLLRVAPPAARLSPFLRLACSIPRSVAQAAGSECGSGESFQLLSRFPVGKQPVHGHGSVFDDGVDLFSVDEFGYRGAAVSD